MSNPIFPYGTSSYIALVSLYGFWRPFVHYGDNLIHQLIPANVFDFDSFSDSLVGGPTPMPNSPIAVLSWGVNKPECRVYYITKNSTLQEMYWNLSLTGFALGSNFGPVVKGSVTLYAMVEADGDELGEYRIGYQSPDNPTTITERIFKGSARGLGWATRIYPNMMN